MKILEVLTQRRITGNKGEDAVARMLRREGYKILKRNYVAKGHEIDIIACNKEYLCFIEVKTRTEGHTDPREVRPASSVTKQKQQAIITAAQEYLALNQGKLKISFDVAEVIVDENRNVKSINYMSGAFTADTAWKRG